MSLYSREHASTKKGGLLVRGSLAFRGQEKQIPDRQVYRIYLGSSELPIKYSSTERAACRPSRIAQTTRD